MAIPKTIKIYVNIRDPAAILFISRDTLSDSIAKLFRACFDGGIAQLSRDTLQNGGIAQVCLCETQYQGGVSHHFGGECYPHLKSILENYPCDPCPDLPFLGVWAKKKTRKTTQKTKDFLPLSSPAKALEKQRRTADNT